ncbi:ATP-binding cassette domain-containing protein [Ruminococcus sp. HUN007]|uniref:ABC transporter ATP-binding protein/permease n=1 Tax=Ruminococcus sp. HUN007 TaxID=1514668 RepID=UPI000678A2F3|nr:ATP-binding cassette domain-containing protein [Ruminococcus sp. HUN007]
MLETKELYKKYKPKKGAEVVAVDHISLRFPEKGMVFLLGKSGSGKSTMLNLLGGLDSYDDGEIIIKGISSKDFNQQRFDSYRNTYVGFIFQEYNVLEDFNVGANIALAIELQGKKASDEEINRILKEVDLEGFGDRNPNELSGGQKQRVAIARALVKNPEIIMADEPTGALDSVTGRQILDTLKKLSEDKLVVIVSHDREYAEQYADRIIELADGKVIRDVEVAGGVNEDEKHLEFDGQEITVPAGYHLTDEDRTRINEYIDKLESGIRLSVSDKGARFTETDESKIPVQDGKNFALIKSVLPMKSAFTIGKSSLKHKKFRLVMTILLSVVAFSLFAFVDTFSSYDHIRSCVDSLRDSEIGYVSLTKNVKQGTGASAWWSSLQNGINEEDLKSIEQDTGIAVTGIFKPKMKGLSFGMNLGDNSDEDEDSGFSLTSSYLTDFCGFAEVTEDTLKNMGYSVYAGRLPDPSKNEIAISCLAAESFIKYGYVSAQPVKDYTGGQGSSDALMDQISQLNIDVDPEMLDKAKDMNSGSSVDSLLEKKKKAEKFSDPMYMVGKSLLLDNELYTVTAVVDTKFDSSRYELLNKDMKKLTNAEQILQFVLSSEYECAVNKSLTGAAMVGEGAVAKLVADEPVAYESSKGNFSVSSFDKQGGLSVYSRYYSKLSLIPQENIVWADKPLENLKNNEIIISLDSLHADYGGMEKEFTAEDAESAKKALEDINDFISSTGKPTGYIYEYSNFDFDGENEVSDIKIVGCFTPDSSYSSAEVMCISDEFLDRIAEVNEGVYSCAVGCMPETRADKEKIVSYCYGGDEDSINERYSMNNAAVYELDSFHSIINGAARVFIWVGLFFAVFASILMANFISTSISYKKQEIGILRAIGSRSNDVFRIFFSESFIIAMIEFVITALLCFAAVCIMNWYIRKSTGILITLLHFGPRQVILILLISCVVAALASFFPVKKTASKKPIDAIRGR